jgi:hypothetical protein
MRSTADGLVVAHSTVRATVVEVPAAVLLDVDEFV